MAFYRKIGINYGLAECLSGIEIQLTLNYPPKSKKSLLNFFKKLRVWAAPIKIFRYNNLLCTDSLLSVCVKQNLKKQAVAFYKRNN